MLVNIHHITWHHIPENSIIKSQKQKTLKMLSNKYSVTTQTKYPKCNKVNTRL